MIIMPSRPTQSFVNNFWSVICASFVVFLSGILFPLLGWYGIGIGVIIFLVLHVVGRRWKSVASLFYAKWNQLAKGYANISRWWIERIFFFLILRTVGLWDSSSPLSLSSPTCSMWKRRNTLFPDSEKKHFSNNLSQRRSKGWVGEYVSWAWKSGNVWAVWLIPFLLILTPLEMDEPSARADNIYTLF